MGNGETEQKRTEQKRMDQEQKRPEQEQKRLEQQLAFCLEIDKEKKIGRQTYLSDGSRKENDAEHAWHMAIMAYILREYSNQEIDLLRAMVMMLIHDIVEIDAGDTFAYDEEGKKDQEERERRAADRLFGMLPPDQEEELRTLWEEFEAMETPEAKFARTMDNIQPTMLNAASGGRGWSEHGVRLDQVLERQSYTGDGAARLWEHSLANWILPHVEKGAILPEAPNRAPEETDSAAAEGPEDPATGEAEADAGA